MHQANGRELYEAEQPYATAWEDMTAIDRRWWRIEAERRAARPVWTWPQRLVIWALTVTVCWGAVAGLVGLVWYLVSRW